MYTVNKQKGCFPAGTRIITEQGLVPIQDIKVGDMVLSKPESGEGELCYKPVISTASYEDKEIWDLWYFEIKANTNLAQLNKDKLLRLSRKGKLNGIAATPNHLFWVKDIGWTRLDKLKNGQTLRTHDEETFALILMVSPLRRTTLLNVAGSYHVRNILDAERKGFDADDVEYFDLCEYDETGLYKILGCDVSSPFNVNHQEIHVLTGTFHQKVYNFEVADHQTYFITEKGLWVHDTNCVDIPSDLLPYNLANHFES
ncbi:hypothetical protein MN869_12990 [Acinetobacter sp. NIPH1876]|uniref:Hint domain-containing protein n=1 Tax=unclassified Acinetobacter TaxID=196816 RepID=UPI001FAB56D0|nr:Hint domain-containing protein [Acinetobacter sp. NIPH1876]MCJ0829357.1 hypothetical protein [Acinetobacter sp. NIPH1876]